MKPGTLLSIREKLGYVFSHCGQIRDDSVEVNIFIHSVIDHTVSWHPKISKYKLQPAELHGLHKLVLNI